MAKVAWGIDIGSASVKAVKIMDTPSGCLVDEWDEIPIKPNADPYHKDNRVADAVATLMISHRFGKTPVYMTISDRLLLVRSFDLPPGSEEKVADLVGYEAKQQIPFPLEQVDWTYTIGHRGDDVVPVTMYAARKSDIAELTSKLNGMNIQGVVPSIGDISKKDS
jgi:type IV pilus assembly protein PilM